MAETNPSGGRERVGAVVARAVDEDRRERFRREDAEHEAADKRLAAEEASFQAGLAAGIDAAVAASADPGAATPAAGGPASGTPDHHCRDCRRKLPVLGRICPECFRHADSVLADVEWWERFAGEYAAAVRFALRYKRLDAESFAALREGFGGYPEEATPFRRASDRILRYGAGHLRELDGSALDAAHDVLVAAFEVPILTGQSHGLVITPAELMRLRRAFIQAEDVVGKVREYAQRTRGEFFGLHDAACDCPRCQERRAKGRDDHPMVRESAGLPGETPPLPVVATSGVPAPESESAYLTPDQIVARVDLVAPVRSCPPFAAD